MARPNLPPLARMHQTPVVRRQAVAGFGRGRRARAREMGSFCQWRFRRVAVGPIGFGFRCSNSGRHAPTTQPATRAGVDAVLPPPKLGSLCKIASGPVSCSSSIRCGIRLIVYPNSEYTIVNYNIPVYSNKLCMSHRRTGTRPARTTPTGTTRPPRRRRGTARGLPRRRTPQPLRTDERGSQATPR